MSKKEKAEVKLTPKLVDYARKLRIFKDKDERLKNDLKDLHKEMEDFNRLFVELMQDNEMSTFKVEKTGTCYLEADIYPDVKDEVTFFTWLRDNGFKYLIKETVHPQTLKAFCKEQMESKNKLPKGVTIFPKPLVKIRRSK